MKRTVLAFTAVVIGGVCHCALAETIHDHFGLDKDPVVAVTVSYVPSHFTSDEGTSGTNRDPQFVAEVTHILKQLPAAGEVQQQFRREMHYDRRIIELHTRAGSDHVLKILGTELPRLLAPAASAGNVHGTYGTTDGRRREQQLFDLVRPIADTGLVWGKPSGGLQCRILPEKQSVAVKPGQPPYDLDVYLTFELRNIGDREARLLPWYTPLEGIAYPMFEVIGPDGEEVRYVGSHKDRPPATPRDYIKIPPGVKLTRRFQLPYDLTKPGAYRVTFRMLQGPKPDNWYYGGNLEKAKKNPDNVWADEIVSNTVTIHIKSAITSARTKRQGCNEGDAIAVEPVRAISESPSEKAPIVPDYDMAQALAKAMADAEPGGLFKFGEAVANNGAEFLPGLVALVEKGDDWIRDEPGLRQWEYAAYVLGQIGDEHCGPVLATRLTDERATSYYFVKPLGQFRVREAVRYLVRWLTEDNEKRWEVRSSAYGVQANYMIEALERITGEDFTPGVGPSGHVERYVKKKQDILSAIDEWWTREGRQEFGQSEVDGVRTNQGGGRTATQAVPREPIPK